MTNIDKAKAQARREVHELFGKSSIIRKEDIFKIINRIKIGGQNG